MEVGLRSRGLVFCDVEENSSSLEQALPSVRSLSLPALSLSFSASFLPLPPSLSSTALFLSKLTVWSRSRNRDGRSAGPHGSRGPNRDGSGSIVMARTAHRRHRRGSEISSAVLQQHLLLQLQHLLLLSSTSTSPSVRFEHGLEASGDGCHPRCLTGRRGKS